MDSEEIILRGCRGEKIDCLARGSENKLDFKGKSV